MPLPTTAVIPPTWDRHHRGAAAGAMTATCALREHRTTPPVYDEDTGTSTATPGAVAWSGACRVQALRSRGAPGDQAGQQVFAARYLIQLDETGPPTPTVLRPGWVVSVLTNPDDPGLVGRVLAVTDVQYGSLRFTRDVLCIDDG